MKQAGVLILVILILLVSCTPSEKVCTENADCVPAACCHAKDAVNNDNAPDCSGVLCSAVCEPGTLDCGQGDVKCISGQCKAVLE